MPSTDATTKPWTLLAGMVILALGVGAYLALVLTNHAEDTDKLLTFLGPSVAALVVVGHQQRQQAETKQALETTNADVKEQLEQLLRQTNGVMDKRIVDGATQALANYDLTSDVRTALADMLAERLPVPVTVVDDETATPPA